MGLRGAASYTPRNYLRGSYNRRMPGGYEKPSIQNQVNLLKRQVAKNSPEKRYFREAYTNTAPAGVSGADLPITSNFVADASFRNNVNGDKWRNHFLKLSGIVDDENLTFRVIVYVPRKTGNTIALPTVASDIPLLHDPSAFWIIDDFYVQKTAQVTDVGWNRVVNLRGLESIYNQDSSILEKGSIRIQLRWNKTGVAIPYYLSTMLCISDK